MTERLIACAIIRDGVTHSSGRAHWEVRAALKDEDPYKGPPSDISGFMTSEGRFVTRDEAKPIAEVAGQCRPQGRELLSSDIDWDARKHEKASRQVRRALSRKVRMR